MNFRFCECGCGGRVVSTYPDGSLRHFVHGHNQRSKRAYWKARPNSENANTGRWRAQRIFKVSQCALAHPSECKGRLERHHRDKNPVNNQPENVVVVCRTHHTFLEKGKITLTSPKLPSFRVDGSGKRRYG